MPSNLKINNTSNNAGNIKKPILLCILDGWGIASKNSKDNAIALANTPNYNQILANYPNSQLGTSGLDVGLPEGQMGNSEVGHTCIGSGRIIFQDLPRINQAIIDGALEQNQNLQNLILACQKSNNVCHLLGLLSDGGIHSHQNHIIALTKILAKNNVNVKLHCFLDGRDAAQKSAKIYLQNWLDETKNFPQIEIVTISGRYYAMDRDKNWNRIELAHKAIAQGDAPKFIDPILAVENSYQQNINDEFVLPAAAENYHGMQDGDALLVANFRADRIRQISTVLLDGKINFSSAVAMTEYSEELNKKFAVLFPTIEIKNSLGEIFADLGLKQLRIAETEKYAHVTFFFSGGQEHEFKGEDRILVQSPPVATYDLLPEMSAAQIGNKLVAAIKSNQYDFIVVNYANPDMVGHSGIISASIKACEAIDKQLGILRDAILQQDGIMIISADHGNIEDMIDEDGNPNTAHTTNPVPFILIGNNVKNLHLKNGRLCDIAPTILNLMNIKHPGEMTGTNLIN
ncbi:MAG: 2,3-bisphosphoglycerate-independent phosphoglycerate mutase [Pseudomonadota bacterium]